MSEADKIIGSLKNSGKKVEEFYVSNKTSDENVANEEITNNKNKYTYIKEVAERIVNEYREKYKDEKFYPEPSEQTCMAYEILHLLAEREQKDKRIQELEVKLKCAKGLYDDCCNCLLNSIPKQVVIDKMEENKQILDKTNDGNLRERLYIENGILKELLEKKK